MLTLQAQGTPTPAYRGPLIDAALLEKSSCTHIVPVLLALQTQAIHSRAGQKGWLAESCLQHSHILGEPSCSSAPRKITFQITTVRAFICCRKVPQLTKSSKSRSKTARDKIFYCPGLRRYFERTVSRVQMPSVIRHSSQSFLSLHLFFIPFQEILKYGRLRAAPKRNSTPLVQMVRFSDASSSAVGNALVHLVSPFKW